MGFLSNNFRSVRHTTQGIASRARRVSALSGKKKLGYGSAMLLAVFCAPLAVQAMTGNGIFDESGSSNDDPPGQVQAEVQSESTGGQGSAASNSSTSVDVTTESSDATHDDSTSVTINGQDVPVPANGQIKKKISNANGQTVVDVTVDNHNVSDSYTNSNTNIQINSQSFTSGSDSHDPRGGDRTSAHR